VTTAIPRLRHLDYGPDVSLDQVGTAGLQAIFDGFDVAAWQPILRAVRRDPWGPVAARVERVLGHLESYGTDAAVAGWLRRCRAGTTAPSRSLAELRREQRLSQREVAIRLGVSQAQVARLEGTALPTLRSVTRYLAALSTRPLAILAVGPDGPRVIPMHHDVQSDPRQT